MATLGIPRNYLRHDHVDKIGSEHYKYIRRSFDGFRSTEL